MERCMKSQSKDSCRVSKAEKYTDTFKFSDQTHESKRRKFMEDPMKSDIQTDGESVKVL